MRARLRILNTLLLISLLGFLVYTTVTNGGLRPWFQPAAVGPVLNPMLAWMIAMMLVTAIQRIKSPALPSILEAGGWYLYWTWLNTAWVVLTIKNQRPPDDGALVITPIVVGLGVAALYPLALLGAAWYRKRSDARKSDPASA